MKKILCFGDSNTYGYIPSTGGRYDKNTRWTGVLQTLCKNNYEIIEAGENNRNALIDSPKILPEYMKINPDTVILAIGINDTQKFFNTDIKNTLEKLVDIVLPIPTIILAPPILNKSILKHPIFSTMFDENSIEQSKKLPEIYFQVARAKGCEFLNLNLQPSKIDGLHYGAEQHKIIAKSIYQMLNYIKCI